MFFIKISNCIIGILLLSILIGVQALSAQEIVADHNSCSQFHLIPDSVIEDIGSDFNIYYVHTSHGSQIMTGIAELFSENSLYDSPPFYEVGDDLGHNGDTSWVPATRVYLNGHPECNMAMFSWCGGCSDRSRPRSQAERSSSRTRPH